MADTPLADFLAEIAQDDELLSNFNGMSLSEADSFLATRNLTPAQRAAVLSRDVTRICAHLTREQPDWGTKQFLVPAGPTMGPPTPGAPPPDLGFAAAPQGTMDPVALDTFAPLGGQRSSPLPNVPSPARPRCDKEGAEEVEEVEEDGGEIVVEEEFYLEAAGEEGWSQGAGRRPPRRQVTTTGGSLTIVGTGIRLGAHLTQEALAHIRRAERFFFLSGDPATARWLQRLNANAESLADCYVEGRPRAAGYAEMAARALAAVASGQRVVVAFYGHPGVGADPTHAMLAQARTLGYSARMLPAISAEACLVADLGVDPLRPGWQSYEAWMFLLTRPRIDVRMSLVLWQIGLIYERGVSVVGRQHPRGMKDLARALTATLSLATQRRAVRSVPIRDRGLPHRALRGARSAGSDRADEHDVVRPTAEWAHQSHYACRADGKVCGLRPSHARVRIAAGAPASATGACYETREDTR